MQISTSLMPQEVNSVSPHPMALAHPDEEEKLTKTDSDHSGSPLAPSPQPAAMFPLEKPVPYVTVNATAAELEESGQKKETPFPVRMDTDSPREPEAPEELHKYVFLPCATSGSQECAVRLT